MSEGATTVRSERHEPVSIALHWLVALGVGAMLAFGYWISTLPRGSEKTDFVQLHKSFGMIVFAAALARLVWRARTGFPEARGAVWERRLAGLSHRLLIALTILMPLTGIVRSLAYARPVSVFGFPVIPQLIAEKNEALNELAGSLHDGCALTLAVLVALHAAAAIKHHVVDRDDTLTRMLPVGRSSSPERRP